MSQHSLEQTLEAIENALHFLRNQNDLLSEKVKAELSEALRAHEISMRDAADIENYDTYIGDLQRQIELTAPWIFNHYVDPEDLLDIPDDEE